MWLPAGLTSTYPQGLIYFWFLYFNLSTSKIDGWMFSRSSLQHCRKPTTWGLIRFESTGVGTFLMRIARRHTYGWSTNQPTTLWPCFAALVIHLLSGLSYFSLNLTDRFPFCLDMVQWASVVWFVWRLWISHCNMIYRYWWLAGHGNRTAWTT